MAAVQQIDVNGAATLIIAWRTGHSAHGAVLKAGGAVLAALREYAQDCLDAITTGHGRPYNPDDDQEDDTAFLTANQDELLDTALLERVRLGSSLPLATPDDIRGRTLALYALLLGDDPDSRAIFIRKGNPVSLASKGIVGVFDDTLTRVTQPILAFDNSFDVVIHEHDVWIINQKNFELLFKESEAVLARTTEWADELARVLPIPSEGTEWLATRLRESSLIRRKVQSILRSPYLSKLDAGTLRAKMSVHELNAEILMEGDTIVFNKETERDLLLLLNEDLWTGDFSGDQYAAARKARRPGT